MDAEQQLAKVALTGRSYRQFTNRETGIKTQLWIRDVVRRGEKGKVGGVATENLLSSGGSRIKFSNKSHFTA